jgi:peptidoglycan hydrolase FlgJ
MTKEEFMATAIAAARASSAKSGLPPGVTVAQAALETGFGSSELSRVANNYFGIKAMHSHAIVEMSTLEYVSGTPVHAVARFAKYDSMAACFADRDLMILSLPQYEEARASAGDPPAFVHALARHWATDPSYAEKILAVYHAHDLQNFDQQSTCASAN